LLFEECRAQLYSSYEESLEAVSRDAHVMVRVKTVEGAIEVCSFLACFVTIIIVDTVSFLTDYYG
jgi:hypothetical protein